jgi:hypothetical protein
MMIICYIKHPHLKIFFEKLLIYIDQSHIIRIVFRFPQGSNVLVNIIRDDLAQGCMIMRQLGIGHDIYFITDKNHLIR